MMRTPLRVTSVSVAILAAVHAPWSFADTDKGAFGAGLLIGEPTGVSAKLYLDPESVMAVDAGLGLSMVGGGLQVHSDVLWHPWVLTEEELFVLPTYLGVGLRFLNHDRGRGQTDDIHVGARAVIGALFDFKTIPLDAFVEVAALLDYRSAGDAHGGFGKLGLNAAAGSRYYF